MTVWLAGGILLSAIFWAAFVYLKRHFGASASQGWAAATQLVPAGFLSVAPWRSVLDPGYGGYVVGLLEYAGRSASLPSTLVLTSLLAAAWVLLRYRGGPAFAIPALVDLAFAANLGLGLFGDEAPRFQLGEHFTLSGVPALALLLMVFVLPFLLVAVWCVRRLRRAS